MQRFIVLFACHDEDTFNLRVSRSFGVNILADVVDDAITDLIEILSDAVFFITSDTLHDEVFGSIYYNQSVKTLLLVNLYFEVMGYLFEVIDFSLDESS